MSSAYFNAFPGVPIEGWTLLAMDEGEVTIVTPKGNIEVIEGKVTHYVASGNLLPTYTDLRLPDNTLSRFGSATKRGRDRPAEELDRPGEIFSPCAAAALFRSRFLHDVGLFDESFGSYFEDVELGLRGRLLGYRFVYEPAARVLHAGHGSALPRGRYVALITRNRLATMLQALPATLLLKHALALCWGQLYFLAAYRRPLSSAAGYLRLAADLPRILARRRELQGRRAVPVKAIDAALARELGETPLLRLLARRLRRAAGAPEAGGGR